MGGQDKMPPAPRAAFHRDGSISDTTYQRTSVEHSELIETRLIEERLRNWKKSNKIITHIRENPFNMHLECLDQIEMRSASDKREVEVGNNGAEMRQQNCPNQLSQLYSKNSPNNDFRTLLYNIICCLLIQDEQVLSTPSVTKMIDAIRAHLESASKFYASAMASLNGASSGSSSADNKSHLLAQQTASQEEDSRRKSSLGSLSCVSSAGSSWSNVPGSVQTQMNSSQTTSTSGQLSVSAISTIWSMCKSDLERAQSNSVQTVKDSRRNQKLANLRRVSSVSYNDEQLINDLCQMEEPAEGGNSSTGPNGAFRTDSPWRYEELSSECRHHPDQTYHHRTSQSSLENNSITTANLIEQTNDSGVGTIYDFQADEFQFRGGQKKRNSDYQLRQQVVDFKPKQQPSYMSTDDYISSTTTTTTSRSIAENRTELYDDEQSSSLPRRDLKEPRQVDVASRRAELEWTLNKLINFELKYAWLTSKDTLRRAIRKIGVPNEIRSKVWLILIEQAVGSSYNIGQLLEAADKTISGFKDNDCPPTAADDEEMDAILKQIELDVNRTMPGHKLFDEGAEGGIKLRRILVAYSIHINRAIAYCQGFNFIVALLLSVFEGDQHKALSGFVCIVDHIFPSKFYFDHYLTGARADQFLLADFICDQLIKNPSTAERKMVEGVTSSITLNWFISLFHGAVPTLTRLTILDHFMLDGVKALFRFTMAILYLAFQVTPPSSCEVFTTIRNTARDMYDIKLLLSIVDQIKLPKDSYFAIRRSFYMVQSSFNSDQFYMQSLSNDASRQLVTNKPLSVQQLPDTKQPAMSLITAASLVAHQSFGITGDYQNFANHSQSVGGPFGPRVCTSSDRTKVCIQNIGKLGRSHIKIMDANIRSNERSLMSPLRNCLVIGVSNCGRKVILARQSSRRNFKTFREQDLTFHVHELCTEIFDGFYLEDIHLALIVTHVGEVFKIDVSRCFADSHSGSTETLMLRENRSIEDHEKVKLRMVSMDVLTNLLWVYVECDDLKPEPILHRQKRINSGDYTLNGDTEKLNDTMAGAKKKYRSNNPFLCDVKDEFRGNFEPQRQNFQRKIIIVDIVSFDVFSAFSIHQNFGDILNMRTSLIAFCQLANPMSNQFSSRIVRIGPTGRYEHLLSFSDVVDFMIDASSNCQKKPSVTNESKDGSNQRYPTFKSLIRSISLNQDNDLVSETAKSRTVGARPANSGTLTRYYRSLIKSYSTVIDSTSINESIFIKRDEKHQVRAEPSNYFFPENPNKAILVSPLNDSGDSIEADYMPVIMVFIFRNGKIALFEFTESYAIHTRESQLDRYDYSKVIGISKSGEDFFITILTIFDKLIKVVI